MRNLSMKKFGTPTRAGPGVASEKVGFETAGLPSGFASFGAGVRRRWCESSLSSTSIPQPRREVEGEVLPVSPSQSPASEFFRFLRSELVSPAGVGVAVLVGVAVAVGSGVGTVVSTGEGKGVGSAEAVGVAVGVPAGVFAGATVAVGAGSVIGVAAGAGGVGSGVGAWAGAATPSTAA